ncbi:hypothetical protein [Nocardioides zeae]
MMLTPAEVAAELRLDSEEELHRLRRRYGWPCTKFGRFKVRFTAEQVEQIKRLHADSRTSAAPSGTNVLALPGQTPGSIARSR